MTIDELAKEVGELRRRLNIAETKLSQQAGQFEFITGQLRDVQLYMHARFDDMDKQFVDLRTDMAEVKSDVSQLTTDVSHLKTDVRDIKAEIKALPRVIAELIAKR